MCWKREIMNTWSAFAYRAILRFSAQCEAKCGEYERSVTQVGLIESEQLPLVMELRVNRQHEQMLHRISIIFLLFTN